MNSVRPPPDIVALDAVSRVFPGPPEVVALRPCSIRIARGDYVAITGPSGSGKTTLLNLLGLLDSPTAGGYRLGGQDTERLSQERLTALRSYWIGFVFQAFYLLPHRSALENVMLGMLYSVKPRSERRRRSEDALRAVDVGHRMQALPRTMSAGEQQRVAIARAIASKPPLLLCDEPTGNLDSENSLAVLEILDKLHGEGHTLVVITHNPTVAGRALRRLQVQDGEVSEDLAMPDGPCLIGHPLRSPPSRRRRSRAHGLRPAMSWRSR